MAKTSKKSEAVKALTVALDVDATMARRLRVRAALNDVSPQDELRGILGLSRKKPQRPRLSLSLKPEDYEFLGNQYGIDPADRNKIKQAIMSTLVDELDEKPKQEE